MIELIFHMLEQFDLNSVQTLLYVAGPLALATGLALLSTFAPYAGLLIGTIANLGSAAAIPATIISGVGIATGIAELGMIASGVGIYAGLGQLASRSMEVALARQRQLYGQNSYRLPQQWQPNINDRYFRKKRPIDIDWVPQIDYSHPNWRNFSPDNIADVFKIDKDAFREILGLSDSLQSLASRFGIDINTAQKIMNLKSKGVSLDKIAKQFGLDLSILSKFKF